MGKGAVLYARVSTDEQADKGYSLPTQLAECRRYSERLGITVVAEFQEECSGTIPIGERREGKKLAMMLDAHKADAIIVYCVDRLSRDIVDLLASVRNWIKAGVEVHTCDIGKVGSELDIVLVIKGWQGSDERKKIIERTTRGKNAKANDGKVVGAAKPPYGYTYDRDESGKPIGLAIHEAEAKTVRKIYRWYVQGDESGKTLTLRAIAKRLSEMVILTPGETRGGKRIRPSGVWNLTTVRAILISAVYTGTWRYGKRIGSDCKRRRPIEEQISVPVPQIIDTDLWQNAKERVEYNKRMSKRNCHKQYFLRGRGKCGYCLGTIVGAYHPRAGIFYECGQKRRRLTDRESKCPQGMVLGEKLESFVWNYVLELWSDRDRFAQALRNAQQSELVVRQA
jgi:site-specific DNA recombinase